MVCEARQGSHIGHLARTDSGVRFPEIKGDVAGRIMGTDVLWMHPLFAGLAVERRRRWAVRYRGIKLGRAVKRHEGAQTARSALQFKAARTSEPLRTPTVRRAKACV